MSDGEITARLMKSTGNKMGRPHLYQQLRKHLLADVYLRRGNVSLMSNKGVVMTPDEQWRNFLKLNQSATVTSYAVLVNDYLDQTNKSPSDSQVREVFEQGKEIAPHDQSATPAFHREYSARFEYLVGDYQDFLDIEIAKLTEDEIKAEYERRIKGGDFQLPEMPAEEPAKEEEKEEAPKEETNAEPAKTEAMKSDAAKQEEPKKSESKADEKAEPKKVSEEPKTEPETENMKEPAEEKPEPVKPEPVKPEPVKEEKPVTTKKVEEPVKEVTKEIPAEAKEPAVVGEKDQSNLHSSSAVRLVVFRAEEEEGDDVKKEEEASEDEQPQKEEPTEDKKEKAEPEATGGNRPLSEVRDQIAEDLAGPAARKAMDAAVTTVTASMKDYFVKIASHQSMLASNQASDAPSRPNLKALAGELGLKHESIGPHTQTSIAKEAIAESFEVGSQFGRRGPGFSIMMYGFANGRTQIAPQPLFAVVRTADDQKGKMFISWKTEETQAYTPTLDQARDEVVMAIRVQEARELAKAAAEDIAKAAGTSGDLAAVIPADKKSNLLESLGPFTWMNSFGFQGASIGNVPELDSVGNEFMKAVFTTKEGGFAVGSNQPERVFYVVKPTKLEPTTDELQTQFKQPVNRMMARMVATHANEIMGGYYESIEEKAGFESFVESE